MVLGRWVRLAVCSGVFCACGGEIHKEHRDIPNGHPGGEQDDGLSLDGGGAATAGAGRGKAGPSGPGAGGESGGTSSKGGASATGGSNAEADAAATLVDPRHDERERLVEQYCTACGKSADCVPEMITRWFTSLPDTCWDEWIASMNCSVANGCSPVSGGQFGGGACLAERTALDTCSVSNRMDGKVTGSTGTCDWERTEPGTSCHVDCPEDLINFYDTDCYGPPGGPYRCICRLNSVEIADAVIENGTIFYVNACEDAAGKLANGYCQKFTSCCYTYTGIPLDGYPEKTLCECTSTADASGSCARIADSKKDGKVVDLCPQYVL
jgi:hypothetical protein